MRSPRHSQPSSLRRAAVAASLLALGACTHLDVPRAVNYAASDQQKIRAVHHWEVLAEDVAGRVSAQLPPDAAKIPVYMAPAGPTAFNQGFRTLLLTHLLKRGASVSTQAGGLELEVQTQLVQHRASRPNANPLPTTTLAAGVLVLRDLLLYRHSNESVNFTGLGLGALRDGLTLAQQGHAAGGPTGTELLVSTTLRQGGLEIARTADVYYIEGADSSLYQAAGSSAAKTWKVVGE